jgi:hypothetical protein
MRSTRLLAEMLATGTHPANESAEEAAKEVAIAYLKMHDEHQAAIEALREIEGVVKYALGD